MPAFSSIALSDPAEGALETETPCPSHSRVIQGSAGAREAIACSSSGPVVDRDRLQLGLQQEGAGDVRGGLRLAVAELEGLVEGEDRRRLVGSDQAGVVAQIAQAVLQAGEIGRASCRERV